MCASTSIVVGCRDGTSGRRKIWVQGRSNPSEVEGDPDAIQRDIEAAARAEQPTYPEAVGLSGSEAQFGPSPRTEQR